MEIGSSEMAYMDVAADLKISLDDVAQMPQYEFELWHLRYLLKSQEMQTAKICQTVLAAVGIKSTLNEFLAIRQPTPEMTDDEIFNAIFRLPKTK